MRRNRFAFAALAALAAAAAAPAARAASDSEELVVKAQLTAEKMIAHPEMPQLTSWLKRARGVLIVPSLLKAGFILGGEGGSGVLLSRDDKGRWSAPAFYTVASGSIGLQIGVQDAQVLFVIMTEKGLAAMIDRQVKLGADASVAVGPTGRGVEGATTLNLDADIYSFALTRGLFGGVSFEGSVAAVRGEWNEAYYGKPVEPKDILIGRTVSNRQADKLRETLAVR